VFQLHSLMQPWLDRQHRVRCPRKHEHAPFSVHSHPSLRNVESCLKVC